MTPIIRPRLSLPVPGRWAHPTGVGLGIGLGLVPGRWAYPTGVRLGIGLGLVPGRWAYLTGVRARVLELLHTQLVGFSQQQELLAE